MTCKGGVCRSDSGAYAWGPSPVHMWTQPSRRTTCTLFCCVFSCLLVAQALQNASSGVRAVVHRLAAALAAAAGERHGYSEHSNTYIGAGTMQNLL